MVFVIAVMAAFAKFTLTRRSRETSNWDIWQAIEFGQSKPQARIKGSTGVKFGDVAGIDDVGSELQELVTYLKNPEYFTRMGTKPPHGVLLEGSPGCGKTLLAKAVAGEAGVPFYQMAGSEFVEILVGVGAARVRDLFKRAEVNRPAVVFIDEIDALGAMRSESSGREQDNDLQHAGVQERETTLNLALMLAKVLGATNRADMLDPALLRPGRFDRRILINPPPAKGRYEILTVHSKKIRLDPEVDLWPYAENLHGWTGARLAQLLQESALVAIRRKHKRVTRHDMDTAVDRLTVGPEVFGVGRRQSVHRRMAVIDIGMAIAAHHLREFENAEVECCARISIVPKGETYSRAIFEMLDDDSYSFARRPTFIHRMQIMLAARIAEEMVYGHDTSSLILLAGLQDLLNMEFGKGNDNAWAECTMAENFRIWASAGELYDDYDLVGESLNPRLDENLEMRTKTLVANTFASTRTILLPYKAALIKAVHVSKAFVLQVIMEKEELLGEELEVILHHYPPHYPPQLVDYEQYPAQLPTAEEDSSLMLLPASCN